MRHLVILVMIAFAFPIIGCGGSGGQPPAGYTINDGWVTTPSGLKFRDIVVSTAGPAIQNGNTVFVKYKGWLDDLTVFDSTDKHGGQPFNFVIGQGKVIKGWDEGLLGLHQGSKTELLIPPSLGYGSTANGGIPANSTLHFTVEIVSVS
jgi:FKBP-type peptidyl-prolyl cis-trans isomerase